MLVRGVGGGCTSPPHVSSLLLILPIKFLQHLSRISNNISSGQRQRNNIQKISDNATIFGFTTLSCCCEKFSRAPSSDCCTGTWLFCLLEHIWRGGVAQTSDQSQSQARAPTPHLIIDNKAGPEHIWRGGVAQTIVGHSNLKSNFR